MNISKIINKFWGWIEVLFEDHKLVRRSLVIWAVWLITLFALKTLDLMVTLDIPTITVVGTFVAILATVTAFYIRSRELDDVDPD